MDPEFLDSQSDESSDDSYDPSYNPKLGSGFLSVTKISEKMRKSQLKERRLRKQSKVSKCAKKLKRKVPTRQIVTNKPENLYKEHRQGPNTRSNELSNQESLPIVGTYSQNMSETTVEPLFQASKDLHIDASDAMDTNEDMSTFASEEINVTLGSDEEKKQNSTGRGDTDSGTSNANIIGIDFEKEGHQNSNSASVAKPIHKVIFSPAIMPPEHPTSVVIPQTSTTESFESVVDNVSKCQVGQRQFKFLFKIKTSDASRPFHVQVVKNTKNSNGHNISSSNTHNIEATPKIELSSCAQSKIIKSQSSISQDGFNCSCNPSNAMLNQSCTSCIQQDKIAEMSTQKFQPKNIAGCELDIQPLVSAEASHRSLFIFENSTAEETTHSFNERHNLLCSKERGNEK